LVHGSEENTTKECITFGRLLVDQFPTEFTAAITHYWIPSIEQKKRNYENLLLIMKEVLCNQRDHKDIIELYKIILNMIIKVLSDETNNIWLGLLADACEGYFLHSKTASDTELVKNDFIEKLT